MRWRMSPAMDLLTRPFLLVALLVGLLAPAASASHVPARSTGERRVILRLEDPVGIPGGPAASALRSEHQAEVVAAVERAAPGAVVERRYSLALNGLAVRLPAGLADPSALRALPRVTAVYEDEPFVPMLHSSVAQIGAPEVWSALGGQAQAGAGVRIAVLDAGIDVHHAMLSPEGLEYPEGYPRGDARYTTPKVIASRIYIRPGDPPLAGEERPVPGPNGSAHGTHLAAVAAGRQADVTYHGVARTIGGVAPAARLLNYRLFYPSASGAEEAFTAEILAAIEDAIADGADVLLAGWASASPTAPFASPVVAALEAAMDAGAVVIGAVGNAGPDLGTASRVPGGSERIIAVGSVSKAEEIRRDFIDVTAPEPVLDDLVGVPFARAEFGGALASVVGPAPLGRVEEVAPDGSPLACDPLPAASLQGRIAIARRGECPFADKAYHAQQAGAVAAIIVNTADELTTIACSGNRCGPGVIRIPVVLVTRTAGDDLIAWGTLHADDASLRIDPGGRPVETTPDVVSPFSGRGPAYQRYLKPDVVAPGEAILSAALSTGDGGSTAVTHLSGTSVAAAHVAGVAALLRQLHPTWGHEELKSALVTTAAPATGGSDDQPPALKWGGGRIDAAAAAGATVAVTPAALSGGQVRAGGRISFEVRLRDLRTDGDPASYTLASEGAEGVSLQLPPPVALAPGEEATLSVVVRVASSARPGSVGATVRLEGGGRTYRLPLWAHVVPAPTTGRILVLDNDFSEFEAHVDYAERVVDALEAAGHDPDYWNADAHFDNPQTVPNLADLQSYEVIVWVTGDNVNPSGFFELLTPLTVADQELLMRYLDGGGTLLAIGKNVAQASDVNPDPDPAWGRSALYHRYLGAHWVQGSLTDEDDDEAQLVAAGLPGTFLEGHSVGLGRSPASATAQESVDEVGPGGERDGADLPLVQPVLIAVGGEPLAGGHVGLAKSCPPTLAEPTPACTYRTLYYSFGPEGAGAPGTTLDLADLLGLSVRWLVDRVRVSIVEAVAAPHEPVTLRAQATSSHGRVVSYRWVSAEGGAPDGVATDEPWAVLTFAEPGTYPVSVTATDTLGHRAVATASVRVVEGGSSSLSARPDAAMPGDEVTFTLRLRNTGTSTVAMAARLAVPEGSGYVSHEGGEFADGALTAAADVAPGGEHVASLRVSIDEDASVGITATAEFTAGEATFARTATVLVGSRLRLPLVFRGHSF